jgi:hypothetical protein
VNTNENARYREAAEYTTTVEAARKAAGVVTPANCLAYELKQYVAAYSQQVYSRENRDKEGPELLSKEHPDYPQRLADREKEGERQLSKIYALHGQELADEWAAARSNNPPDERLLLACFLKESAHRLLAGYADYLIRVGEGRILSARVSFGMRIGGDVRPVETFESRLNRMKERREKGSPGYGLSYGAGRYGELDRSLIAAGAGAAELAHFQQLLAAFQERERGSQTDMPAAPSSGATPPPLVSSQANDLAPAIRKRTVYFRQLLEQLAAAPAGDTHELLSEALDSYKKGESDGLQGLKFIPRLLHYLPTVTMGHEWLTSIENWAFWAKHREEKALAERMEPEGKKVVTEADRVTMENRLKVFSGRKDAQTNEVVAGNIALLKRRLAELDAAPTPKATQLPNPHKLSLRQAAILYFYTEQPLTENNVSELAASVGHASKTSGKQLFEKYADWCELQESELPDSKRELGYLKRDLEAALQRLTGNAAIRADTYLKEVIKKKKRGL